MTTSEAVRAVLLPLLAATLLSTGLGGCAKKPAAADSSVRPDTPARRASAAPGKKKDGYTYQWSQACAGCHPKHHAQWDRSMHALAHKDAIYDFYFMRASRDSKKKLEPYCGRCHTPLAVRSGEIPFPHPLRVAGDTHVSKTAAEGVQCDFCHTISAQRALKNGGYELTPGNVKRSPLPNPHPINHQAFVDPKYRSAEYCGTCHQVVHPENGILLETTYSEWKKSPYAKAGIVCQDCHMTDGLVPPTADSAAHIGRPPKHPGKAAIMGKQRPHISRHLFVGPNLVFIESGPKASAADEAERAARLRLLRRAGRVSITGLTRHIATKRYTLGIRVTNTGAGHFLPTGVTEVRELWLEITIRDSKGKVLLEFGHPDKAGNLPKGTHLYRTEVRDAAEKDTPLFWNTVKKIRDRRIPPLGHVDEHIVLPAQLKGSITVDVALCYRSISPSGLAAADIPPGSVTVPILIIHRVKKTLTL